MAINRICTVCKSNSKLKNETCSCGADLNKVGRYRVRVKLSNGQWLTKVVDGLQQAKGVEAKYRKDKIDAGVHGIFKAPLIDLAWKKMKPGWAE